MNQGLGLLANQLYRSLPKSVTPALRFGFAVDGRGGVEKSIVPSSRSIPMKCHCVQLPAALEGPIPDAGDAVTNRDVRQAGAASESALPNAGYAVRYRDVR